MRGGALIWPLRIGLVACCAVAPWFMEPWCVVVLLLALPVLRALLDAMRERLTARACVLGGCLCAGLTLPRWVLPVIILWGTGLLAMSLLRVPCGSRTIRASVLHGLATGVTLLALLVWRMDGLLVPGLAQALVDWVDRSPNSVKLLLSAYQIGLSRLEGQLALVPALRIFQAVIIPPAVRQELLYSLRTSLESLLQLYLPRWMMGWLLLTALLPALAAEGYLHSRRRRSDLPPPTQWHIPEGWAVAVLLMLLMSFLPYLTNSPVLICMGEMCSTLGYWAYAIQGAALLTAVLAKRRASPLLIGAIVALGVTVLPLVLFFLGGYDQLSDPRQLRGAHQDMD